jgi:hypothetical protein
MHVSITITTAIFSLAYLTTTLPTILIPSIPGDTLAQYQGNQVYATRAQTEKDPTFDRHSYRSRALGPRHPWVSLTPSPYKLHPSSQNL